MTTIEQLTQIFCDNFVTYFKSHASHVNVEGRNFVSDHELLGKVYEDLQGQIDYIGELLRTLGAYMPDNLYTILQDSHIDPAPAAGTADAMLNTAMDDLDHLVECYEELERVADSEGLAHIGNYAQDRVTALTKFTWMLKSTLA